MIFNLVKSHAYSSPEPHEEHDHAILAELVATIAAVRIRVYDLAVCNLFVSNLVNMFALGIIDLFYLQAAS